MEPTSSLAGHFLRGTRSRQGRKLLDSNGPDALALTLECGPSAWPGSQSRSSCSRGAPDRAPSSPRSHRHLASVTRDRKSTRLNSSHSQISYAVFCLKKKKLVFSPSSPS